MRNALLFSFGPRVVVGGFQRRASLSSCSIVREGAFVVGHGVRAQGYCGKGPWYCCFKEHESWRGESKTSYSASFLFTKRQVVVELPYSLHVNSKFARRYVPDEMSAMDPQLGIATYLALERFKKLAPRKSPSWLSWFWPWSGEGVSSALPEYVAMMPDRVENAAYWEDEDFLEARRYFPQLQPLHNLSWVWTQVEGKVNLTRVKLFMILGCVLVIFFFKKDEFWWGYSMLLSRSFKDIEGELSASFFFFRLFLKTLTR